LAFLIGCGGGSSDDAVNSSSSTSEPVIITAIDGYIKDATLKDSSGQIAEYNGSGKYVFKNIPVYPITLSGGVLEDINVSFDINLTLNNEDLKIISPITTFIDGNTSLYEKLKDLNITSNDLYSDYIESNDTNLAKLSELLYVVLHDNTTMKQNFANSLETNTSVKTLDDLFVLAKDAVYKSSLNSTQRVNLIGLLHAIEDINSSVVSAKDVENYLKVYKIIVKNHYKDPSFISTLATGQTTSYYPNDDGDLQKGTPRSYTRDDAKEVVIDNATALMWQDNYDSATITFSWSHASDAVEYCENLTLGGYDDWRLPSLEELISITDKGRDNPAVNSVFQNIYNGNYYSSSIISFLHEDYLALWSVFFSRSGGCDYDDFYLVDNYYIRCVRDNK